MNKCLVILLVFLTMGYTNPKKNISTDNIVDTVVNREGVEKPPLKHLALIDSILDKNTNNQTFDAFKKHIESKFWRIVEDSTFCDTFLVNNYKIIVSNIAKDSCLRLMHESNSISFFGSCRTGRKEQLNDFSTRLNDSTLIVTFLNGETDTIKNRKGSVEYGDLVFDSRAYEYFGYIPKLSYHVLSSTGYESCGFQILKAPNDYLKFDFNEGFAINQNHTLFFSYCETGLELGAFQLYRLENNSLIKIMDYYQKEGSDFLGDVQLVYWVTDSTLAIIKGGYNAKRPFDSYAILKIIPDDNN